MKDLSLENDLPQIVYCTKISLCLYALTAGRNVKGFTLENVLPQIVYCTKISES